MFDSIFLKPELPIAVDKRSFACWNDQLHDWYAESGEYVIEIGESSRDIRACQPVKLISTASIPRRYDVNSIFLDIEGDSRAMAVLKPLMDAGAAFLSPEENDKPSDAAKEAISDEMNQAMASYMPLRGLLSFAEGKLTWEMLESIVRQMNGEA